MTQLTFDKTLALSIYNSDEQFPIDLDDAWLWLGWASKQKALDCLVANFEEGTDFLTLGKKASNGGRPGKHIMLTVDCFKCFAMMSGTEQGKVIRKYFIECESIAKEANIKALPSVSTSKLTELKANDALVRHHIRVLESELAEKRMELQSIQKELFTEAKAVLDANPELARAVLDAREIIERAKQANKYLSV
ncbi:antA/AntB antirepressor family protein [Nostoc sp. TCL240-02]|uniref:antA/AntB antirepressor family protein n=1 Tax=Nostoc sp. TCL240-02 TaxID=2572090 RepID=UPI00157F98AE|nr:antA/AntB antirepressor family protein [Nostoc sp. TCL240-02]QKQ76361.1 hypothetical protein FBB35_26490 [Nostoc sp. TCL240-02]QKQ76464.1 hypothetical protein FBB35_27055 [Nostoc sp. TCL240-02]